MRIRPICSSLLAVGMLFLAIPSFAQICIGISIGIAPPPLGVYEQPMCPGDGYLWTPGYWAWANNDYYMVPGAWVMAPEAGFLWTPGYWGWGNNGYFFNEGYWGESVGFYGGINYGYGYFGNGYEGGRWNNGHFYYNTSVNRVNVNIEHNVYNTRIDEHSESRVSYNGGQGGTTARATSEQEAAAHSRHIGPVEAQTRVAMTARDNPRQRFSAHQASPVHPRELAPVAHPAAPNTGNSRLDSKYQKQQDRLAAQQSQERLKLQASQDKEHRQLAKQNAPAARTQQVEQRHQQQTQQMQQHQTEQMGQMQERQQPSGGGSHGEHR